MPLRENASVCACACRALCKLSVRLCACDVRAHSRQALFDDFRVFISDALWMTDASMAAIHHFFSTLPLQLLNEGVLAGRGPEYFATLMVADTFKYVRARRLGIQ